MEDQDNIGFPEVENSHGIDLKDIEEGVQILLHRVMVKQKKAMEASDTLDAMTKSIAAAGKMRPLTKMQDRALTKMERQALAVGKPLGELVGSSSDMMARGLRLEKYYDKMKKRAKELDNLEGKVKASQTVADVIGVTRTLAMGIAEVADAATFKECGTIITDCERGIAVGLAAVALAKDLGIMAKDAISA